jgi:prefoldin subunit 5
MTQSQEPNDRDIYTRLATLEYQVTEIQNTQAQLRATIAPGGYVTDAFERVVGRIDERINESEGRIIQHVDTRMDEMNSKIDTILRSITGLGNS